MKKAKGFTLIELMIVVAIIGILAAVAIPRFADLIRQANEASCKGNLGALRSALSIYYGSNEGFWPTGLGTLVPDYMSEIPDAKPGAPGTSASSAVEVEVDGTSMASINANTNGWWYNNGSAASGEYDGAIKVNVVATDTKGAAIHSW